MEEASDMAEQRLMKELKEIKAELKFIKLHMVDADSIMTEDDYAALQEYKKQKTAGKLISHAQLKEELGL